MLISPANMATAKMISDSLDLHGVGAGGINSRCLGVMGAGQIDKNGNINSTIIRSRKGKDIYLAGAGGGAEVHVGGDVLNPEVGVWIGVGVVMPMASRTR